MDLKGIILSSLLATGCATTQAIPNKADLTYKAQEEQGQLLCGPIKSYYMCLMEYTDRDETFAVGNSMDVASCNVLITEKNPYTSTFMKDFECDGKVDRYLFTNNLGEETYLKREEDLELFEKDFDLEFKRVKETNLKELSKEKDKKWI